MFAVRSAVWFLVALLVSSLVFVGRRRKKLPVVPMWRNGPAPQSLTPQQLNFIRFARDQYEAARACVDEGRPISGRLVDMVLYYLVGAYLYDANASDGGSRTWCDIKDLLDTVDDLVLRPQLFEIVLCSEPWTKSIMVCQFGFILEAATGVVFPPDVLCEVLDAERAPQGAGDCISENRWEFLHHLGFMVRPCPDGEDEWFWPTAELSGNEIGDEDRASATIH